MKLLRCLGLSCGILSPATLAADWSALADGFCVCEAALERADRRQRLRVARKLRVSRHRSVQGSPVVLHPRRESVGQ